MSGGSVLRYGPGTEATARRVESILGIAGAHRTGVPVDSLTELLPEDGPRSPTDLVEWIGAHPSIGTVVGARAFLPSFRPPYSDLDDRRARGERYWNRAVELPAGRLRMVRPLLRTLAVTGSTAYGEPEAGDDLDFLAVTRPDSVWVFLTYTYLRLRLWGLGPTSDDEPGPCFNYVVDEATAKHQFAESRGLLFAREALTSRPIVGEEYYRDLVRSAPWMRDELPRLYARWQAVPVGAPPSHVATPWPVRVLNWALFPLVATYLQMRGLLRNRRLRASGQGDRAFRTVAHYRYLMFATERFERLRRAHEAGSVMGGPAA